MFYKQITNIPPSQIHAQLYSSCTDTVPTSLVNTVTNFFDLNATQLLQTLEQIVTKKSNPTVHWLHFSSLHQSETEPIQDFVVSLKSIVPDCKFTYSNCQHDIQEQHIKDQLIRGSFNKTLQIDILAKASHLKSFQDIIKYAEAFEVAQCHHTHLQQLPEGQAFRLSSSYWKQKVTPDKGFIKNTRLMYNPAK